MIGNCWGGTLTWQPGYNPYNELLLKAVNSLLIFRLVDLTIIFIMLLLKKITIIGSAFFFFLQKVHLYYRLGEKEELTLGTFCNTDLI